VITGTPLVSSDNPSVPPPGFRQVYNGEAKVFEYSPALPRASVFYSAQVVSSTGEALERLRDPKLDVSRTVVLAEEDPGIRGRLAGVNRTGEDPRPAEAASITAYDSQK